MKKNEEYWNNVKSRSENRSGATCIIASKSQFRGNTVNMWTCTSNDRSEIVVSNSYYMGHVIQTYLINDDMTIVEYTNNTPAPKWMTSMFSNNKDIRIQMKDMYCQFSGWQYVLGCKTEKKGLMFSGNIDNISTLKELKRILSNVRSIIKRYAYEDVAELAAPEIVEGELHYRDTLVINYDRLVKFDRRMSDRSE